MPHFFGLGATELIILALCLGIPVIAGVFALIYWLTRSGHDGDSAGGDQ
jgi:hypothetical protein